jgi:hypothetical protein
MVTDLDSRLFYKTRTLIIKKDTIYKMISLKAWVENQLVLLKEGGSASALRENTLIKVEIVS